MTVPVSGAPDLTDSTVVVTGAGGAIGRETCAALARQGADIAATDVDADGLAAAKSRVEAHDRECVTYEADVSNRDEVFAFRDAVLEDGDVDAVVTVHGIVSRGGFDEMSEKRWDRAIAVNLTGTALVVEAFYDHLRENGGKIVCVGSVAGQIGGVISGPDYVASKAGVHGFVKWVARNGAADGVNANAIAPGPVWSPMTEGESGYDDDMTPLNRLGEPEDIAEAVVFLASPQSNWITGTVLDVNGGIRMN